MNKYHRRKNHRLKEFDYTQAGYYFITICTYNRDILFGEIITIHGIIIIRNTDSVTDTARRVPTGQFGKPVSGELSTIIRSFKSAVTKRINGLRNATTPPVWQPSFYDHIIRTEKSLNTIREYISNNPANWDTDENNLNHNKSFHILFHNTMHI